MNSSFRYNWPFARNFPPSVGPEPPIQYVAIMNTNVGVFIFLLRPRGNFRRFGKYFNLISKQAPFRLALRHRFAKIF